MKSVRIIILILALVVIIIGSGVYYYLLTDKKYNNFYILTDKEVVLKENDPVYMDGIAAGKVSKVYNSRFTKGKKFIQFQLEKEFSIPDKSIVEFVNKENKKDWTIEIILKASSSYLLPEDTFFVYKTVEIDSTPSQSVKRNEVEKIIDGEKSLEGVIYRVQLLSSKEKIPLNSDKFKGILDIEEMHIDNYYKYFTGSSGKLADVSQLKTEIKQKGVKDAFVVAFYNGERISIKQALTLEK